MRPHGFPAVEFFGSPFPFLAGPALCQLSPLRTGHSSFAPSGVAPLGAASCHTDYHRAGITTVTSLISAPRCAALHHLPSAAQRLLASRSAALFRPPRSDPRRLSKRTRGTMSQSTAAGMSHLKKKCSAGFGCNAERADPVVCQKRCVNDSSEYLPL